MVHPARFELTTYCSGGNRSIQLSYGCTVWFLSAPAAFGQFLYYITSSRKFNSRIQKNARFFHFSA